MREKLRMPLGKFINVPINEITSTWHLLYYLAPKMAAKLNPELLQAIYKQAGKMLKENGFTIPEKEATDKSK